MKYSKPKIIAQNKTTGSYAAGCPADKNGFEWRCRNCDRVK